MINSPVLTRDSVAGLLTLEDLKEILDYDSDTGIFKWKINKGPAQIGKIAGCKNKFGYIRINLTVKGIRKTVLAHRLAWFYFYGTWPKNLIDHKDGISDHNWIKNLREASHQQNNWNKKVSKFNKSGIKGVSTRKDGKFVVYVCLGSFTSKEEAARVYKEAVVKLQGEFMHSSIA
jgi:hypothetical protein